VRLEGTFFEVLVLFSRAAFLMALQGLKTLVRSGAVLLLALVFGFGAPAMSLAAEATAETTLETSAEKTAEPASGASANGVSEMAEAKEIAAADNEEGDNDPLEPLNRVIFEFNEIIQDVILRPVTKFYNETVHVTVRLGVSNFLDNLSSPVVLANDVLQGEFDRALQTFGRAFVNTTVGIFGIADVAAELGVESHKEDFGQTLAVYGIGEGLYLVLPVFGPSNPRDAVGKLLVDSYFNPLGLWLSNTDQTEVIYSLAAAKGIDEYARIVDELNQVKKTSVDYYAAVRSLYRQKRKAEIKNGSELELPPIPDLSYDVAPQNFSQSLANVGQAPTAQ